MSMRSDTLSVGLLLLRLVFGLAMASHGAQKLFGWFGGYGLKGTGGYLESIGFSPGRGFALAVGLAELASGLLVAIGLFGPVGPALMLSIMIVAAIAVHTKNGFYSTNNGIEVPLLYGAGAIALALTGPGSYALDRTLGLESVWTPSTAVLALAAGVLGAAANILTRRRVGAA
jgi:putative oxidoreductase